MQKCKWKKFQFKIYIFTNNNEKCVSTNFVPEDIVTAVLFNTGIPPNLSKK